MTIVKVKTEDLMNVKEVAEALGVTRLTVYRWINKGKILSMLFGKYRAIPRSEVARIKKESK